MQLQELLAALPDLTVEQDIAIAQLAIDSRKVTLGSLFFAYPGTINDGRKYIKQSIANGAVVVLYENADDYTFSSEHCTCIGVTNLADYVGEIAAIFYGNPSKKLQIFGVTGTNGKSSCVHYLCYSLVALGKPCWMIGTLGSGFIDKLNDVGHTTPDPIAVQAELAKAVATGAKSCAMEVSSHALDQGRVNGVEFDVAVFTNITHEHLDYHYTMQNYVAAKAKLFSMAKTAVVFNTDDKYGQELAAKEYAADVWTYAVLPAGDNNDISRKANHLDALINNIDATGFTITVSNYNEIHKEVFALLGRFNVANILAIITALYSAGYSLNSVITALQGVTPVLGRMETIKLKNSAIAVVDYAHTPDALSQVLQNLRQLCKAKLWCVFGCGGDRDRAKRPLMLDAALQYADNIIVTSDNPRHEDPQAIIDEIIAAAKSDAINIEIDRAKAIKYAVQNCAANDIILVAGKGHECTQIIGDQEIKFSDMEHIKQCD